MAFTQADIDALKAALATGALTVRAPDGRMVTYRSVDEMLRTLARMEAEVGSADGVRPRTTFASFQKD